MPSRRIAVTGSLSESERRTLRGLYTSGPTAYGSAKTLIDASGLSKKESSTIFTCKQCIHTVSYSISKVPETLGHCQSNQRNLVHGFGSDG